MKGILNYLKRLNEALPMLVAVILIYGLLILVTGVWFFEDRGKYAVGLLVGIAQAVFLSINMASGILAAIEVSDKRGQTKIAFKAIFRYIVIVITTFLMCYYEVGYIGTWLAGVMGLKVSALLQPLIHRFINKKKEIIE